MPPTGIFFETTDKKFSMSIIFLKFNNIILWYWFSSYGFDWSHAAIYIKFSQFESEKFNCENVAA